MTVKNRPNCAATDWLRAAAEVLPSDEYEDLAARVLRLRAASDELRIAVGAFAGRGAGDIGPHARPTSSDGPPVALMASGRTWSLSIVIYPSGPYLELIEIVDGVNRLVYSEGLGNLALAAKVLKERG